MSVKIILLALETLLLSAWILPLPVICSGNLLGIIVSVMLMLITANWTKFCGIISKIWGSECLGVELDGSETLRAWGRGKNRTDAIEQAKKNAVRDVLFKGVVAGSRECSVRPLITEVNAQERYASYFNDFFRDGGEYLKYVSMEDKKTNSNTKASNKTQISYSTTVRVLRSQLQQKLIEDKILKP